MNAPGKSDFWTKTFHAALTGLCAAGRVTSAIELACNIADTTERELSEQEAARKERAAEERFQEEKVAAAKVLAQKYYKNGALYFEVERINNSSVWFTNGRHGNLFALTECEEGWEPCEAPNAGGTS